MELQVEEIRKAATDELLSDHASKNGGTHGLGPQDVFESQAGAQAKAQAALNAAKEYTDETVAELRQGGTTGSRPGNPAPYTMYFDTDLGMPIWWDGQNWVDAAGTVV